MPPPCPPCLRGERPAIDARQAGTPRVPPPPREGTRPVPAHGEGVRPRPRGVHRLLRPTLWGEVDLGDGGPARPARLPGRPPAPRPCQALGRAGALGGAEPVSLPAGKSGGEEQHRPRGAGTEARQAPPHLHGPGSDADALRVGGDARRRG